MDINIAVTVSLRREGERREEGGRKEREGISGKGNRKENEEEGGREAKT